MRFDWYSATVPGAKPQAVAEVVGAAFSTWAGWQPEKARNGYSDAAALYHGDLRRAAIYWGGAVGEHGPHVASSGEDSPLVAGALRECFPLHRVSRADACEDYSAPGSFAVLCRVAESVAQARDVRAKRIVPIAGQEHRGATLYLGAAGSDVRVRVYEKGKQLRELGDDPEANEHHARVEVQVRPPGRVAKEAVAQLSPSALWGCARWTQDLAKLLGNEGLEPVVMRTWRQTDVDRAINAVVRQYWRTFEAMCVQEGGSWSDVGERLGSLVGEHRRRAEDRGEGAEGTGGA